MQMSSDFSWPNNISNLAVDLGRMPGEKDHMPIIVEVAHRQSGSTGSNKPPPPQDRHQNKQRPRKPSVVCTRVSTATHKTLRDKNQSQLIGTDTTINDD